ncbi:MAG: hypothetical protein AUJ12_00040 [Alphaproteobacteria bacterium CG1_02_46_17]|nr:MAG: hypothetical protein AUJ12_00040 [Alphaproteobacteria bacterium CG1_02_46_17]
MPLSSTELSLKQDRNQETLEHLRRLNIIVETKAAFMMTMPIEYMIVAGTKFWTASNTKICLTIAMPWAVAISSYGLAQTLRKVGI